MIIRVCSINFFLEIMMAKKITLNHILILSCVSIFTTGLGCVLYMRPYIWALTIFSKTNMRRGLRAMILKMEDYKNNEFATKLGFDLLKYSFN